MIEIKKFDRTSKSKFLLFDILNHIDKGETPFDIYKKYGWNRQRLDYWIKILKKTGLITLKARSNIAIYELTPRGKNFLIEYVSVFNDSIRLHNIIFTYPILEHGNLVPDKEWKLKGISNRLKKETGGSIVWNDKSLSIHISSLIGNSAFDLSNRARTIADNFSARLRQEYGFKLGEPKLSRKPHFAVLNPLIDKISKQIEFSSEDAKIDESEGSGELEFFEPGKVQNFIDMPETLKKLFEHTVKQTEIMDQFSKQMALHLSVMEAIKDSIGELTKGVNELRDAVKELQK